MILVRFIATTDSLLSSCIIFVLYFRWVMQAGHQEVALTADKVARIKVKLVKITSFSEVWNSKVKIKNTECFFKKDYVIF